MALKPYGIAAIAIVVNMPWAVEFHPEFEPEFDELPEPVHGGSEKAFYKQLIKKADERFDAHLAPMKKVRKPK